MPTPESHYGPPPSYPTEPHTPRHAPEPPPDVLCNPYRNSTPLSRLPSLPLSPPPLPPPKPLDATKPGRRISPPLHHAPHDDLKLFDPLDRPMQEIHLGHSKLWPATQTFAPDRKVRTFVIDRGTSFARKDLRDVLGSTDEKAGSGRRRSGKGGRRRRKARGGRVLFTVLLVIIILLTITAIGVLAAVLAGMNEKKAIATHGSGSSGRRWALDEQSAGDQMKRKLSKRSLNEGMMVPVWA